MAEHIGRYLVIEDECQKGLLYLDQIVLLDEEDNQQNFKPHQEVRVIVRSVD